MMYLFHGSDESGVRAKAFAWIAAARAKAPDAHYVRLDANTITEEAIAEAITAQGLFFSKSLIALDDPFAKAESGRVVEALLAELAGSENPVALITPKSAPKLTATLAAVAHKVFTIDAKAKPARGFNSGLVNALAARDAKKLWIEITRAYALGDPPEMVHGLLHWKARDLMQKGGRGWSFDEARALSRALILLVTESRGGGLPLTESLERFALRLQ